MASPASHYAVPLTPSRVSSISPQPTTGVAIAVNSAAEIAAGVAATIRRVRRGSVYPSDQPRQWLMVSVYNYFRIYDNIILNINGYSSDSCFDDTDDEDDGNCHEVNRQATDKKQEKNLSKTTRPPKWILRNKIYIQT